MSFSSRLKDELINSYLIGESGAYAQIVAAAIKYRGTQLENEVTFTTYNFEFAKLVTFILEKSFKIKYSVRVRQKRGIEKSDSIIITFKNTKFMQLEIQSQIEFAVMICLFGSFVDPQKYYSFELKPYQLIEPLLIKEIEKELKIKFKKIKNKSLYYIKDGEKISNIMIYYRLNSVLFEFEDIRIMKDMRNNYNRQDNFYIANEVKKQQKIEEYLKIIDKIMKNEGIRTNLKDRERQIIEYRKNHVDKSLTELVEIMRQDKIKVSKSSISTLFSKYRSLLD
jgi:DNA-binding transcriptional regulator WhiA